uniref:aspartyl aminopeptidase n=1 Tax=Rhizochromulina marina TaxID=1034831 RepID=A0A7S2SV01_9STRA|mmetsp:Transcript_8886/g.25365  ORF Transcript_8886/g.25365 Transcript_8886/m.25365 type:complete len:499 (+) Transcript_8886:65-1561(+)|eukprot:CAMPEP_0118975808 /NCGR_PEP_ID=MMETSP1173-20130426/16853_1 /TAXON_ID=1034831 /ORGANISM="Rhizochromulina marina cf, Strain CCMP1243" /LENGTH=498 /DNA_ID=CAMNT_0006925749 /DNA_START=8 /DNA_END=1504 /DNA_ORIENTATION=+
MASARGTKRQKVHEDGETEADRFVAYLNESQSPFHCVDAVKRRLVAAGFTQLDERKPWELERGGKYFATRNGSSLIAFAVGGAFDPDSSGFIIIGGHTDSPCPKLKPISKLEKEGAHMLGVVGYGGGLWHTWFDRDLTVVGRALIRTAEDRLEPRMVSVGRALCRIPTLAIHLSVGDERTTFKPNLESHFPPLLATEIKAALWRDTKTMNGAPGEAGASSRHTPLLMSVVAEELGCEVSDIVDFELQLADTQPSAIIGACREFVSSGRLDNQGTCFTGTRGLIDSLDDGSLATDTSVRMLTMFDHEEVGSLSAQGAQSPFFDETLARVSAALGADFFSIKARSFQISSDMAHAVHPNYSERHDGKNRPRLHGGMVIKHNANQRYATNSIGASLIRRFAELAGVPIQEFAVKADSGCGTTIGPITGAGTGIRTVDVGPPQLSMHSCREMMATDDVVHAVQLFVAAYRSYSTLSKTVEVDGPDPFWAAPGVGWGLKTTSH